MACEVCEHCHGPVSINETKIRDGFSYHQECHKCFVCSETNLQDAEVFNGVIFCSSCSQRIFQGCSMARQAKNPVRRSRNKANANHRPNKKRSHRTQDRRSSRHDGILELTTRAVFSDSSNSSDHVIKLSSRKIEPLEPSIVQTEAAKDQKEVSSEKSTSLKQSSTEIGMTTEVTQELLKQMNCPVVADHRKAATSKRKTISKNCLQKPDCCDLRIAELGVSTEIANMALRRKSELPIIIKTESTFQKRDSSGMSEVHRILDESGVDEEWTDSEYSSLRNSTKTDWMDRRLGSILKIPFRAFRQNILNRSSLISVLLSSKSAMWPVRDEHNGMFFSTLKKKIKSLFYEEINEHQKKGLKKLYSMINRNKTPKKLGWLDFADTKFCADCQKERCKHFKRSHSYRCMRAQVMRLAGPTSSELAVFRTKVKNIVTPGFLHNFSLFNNKYAAVMSQACGNSLTGSIKV